MSRYLQRLAQRSGMGPAGAGRGVAAPSGSPVPGSIEVNEVRQVTSPPTGSRPDNGLPSPPAATTSEPGEPPEVTPVTASPAMDRPATAPVRQSFTKVLDEERASPVLPVSARDELPSAGPGPVVVGREDPVQEPVEAGTTGTRSGHDERVPPGAADRDAVPLVDRPAPIVAPSADPVVEASTSVHESEAALDTADAFFRAGAAVTSAPAGAEATPALPSSPASSPESEPRQAVIGRLREPAPETVTTSATGRAGPAEITIGRIAIEINEPPQPATIVQTVTAAHAAQPVQPRSDRQLRRLYLRGW